MFSIFTKAIKKGIVTIPYPASKANIPLRSRGALKVNEYCNLCKSCISVCPTKAISIEGKKIIVNHGSCIFCGKCVESCIKGALQHSTHFELAYEDGVTLLNNKIKSIFARSLQIRHLDSGSCNACDWEMMAMTNPVYDLQRLGIDIVPSPRHADILLVTGVVSKNIEQVVKMTYEATPEPKLVMAVGACAIDGGIFKDSIAVLNGADKVIPVDVYVPGCPPRPEAIIFGLLKVLDRV